MGRTEDKPDMEYLLFLLEADRLAFEEIKDIAIGQADKLACIMILDEVNKIAKLRLEALSK